MTEIIRAPIRDIKLAEVAANRFRVVARAATRPDDVLHPGYLWHGHTQMRPHDMVEVVHEQGRFMVWLLVIRIDPETQSVHCRELNVWDFTEAPALVPDLTQARIENMGEAGKWSIIAGTATLSSGHATKKAAEEWLAKKKAGE